MNRTQTLVLAALVAASLPSTLLASQRSPGPSSARVTRSARASDAPSDSADRPRTYRYSNQLRIGQSYVLGWNEQTSDIEVIWGQATIAGFANSVTVVHGDITLTRTAVVYGPVLVLDGNVTIEQGAQVHGDTFVIGGSLNVPPDIPSGSANVVVISPTFGPLRDGIPWLTKGLLWGRPIVPELPWVWVALAAVLLLQLVLAATCGRAVRACARTLASRPITTFGVGILVLLLVGPVALLLTVSVVGILVVPFLFLALGAGWLIGKVGVSRWIGNGIVSDELTERRWPALRSVLIGFALICAAYTIPVLGLVAWGVTGVFGLGSAALTFLSAYRRENPRAERKRGVMPASIAPGAFAASAPPPVHNSAIHPPSTPVASEPPVPAGAPASSADAPSSSADMPPTPEARAAYLVTFPHAFMRDRIAAAALDTILVLFVAQCFGPYRTERAFVLGMLIYHVASWSSIQTTVGGIICNLRLVRTDGRPLAFADALVRTLAGIFSMIVCGLGWFSAYRDAERQSWHDRIAGTYVVKVPRNWSLNRGL